LHLKGHQWLEITIVIIMHQQHNRTDDQTDPQAESISKYQMHTDNIIQLDCSHVYSNVKITQMLRVHADKINIPQQALRQNILQ